MSRLTPSLELQFRNDALGLGRHAHVSRHLLAEIDALRLERDAATAFKVYVHRRLDDMGVAETFPDGEHSKQGCRVGDRLDWVQAQVPQCYFCGKPAACMARCADLVLFKPACDECCGHSNEDSECFPIAELASRYSALRGEAKAEGADLATLRAEQERLTRKLAERDTVIDAITATAERYASILEQAHLLPAPTGEDQR